MLRAVWGLFFSILACSAFAQSDGEARYTVMIMGKPAGVQTSVMRSDGSREFTFEFNDRGRGPKLTSQMRLDAAGIPVSIETGGHDYLKAPVSERFELASGVARWKNPAESGERKLSQPAFYVSMHGVPAEQALLARALLQAPGMRLPLLPEGEARLKRTSEMTVGSGASARRVTSYEISGLDFTPSTVWLDERLELFASVSSWFSFVREGWENTAQALLEKQDAMDAARTRELARSLTQRPARTIAITNANLFDAERGRSVPGTTVIIEGNRVREVGKDGEVSVPGDAHRIDAKGRALLPGLWDMHVHMAPDEGLLHIAAGVTSVRDLANDNDMLSDLEKKIEASEEIGPRIVRRGFMDGRGPYAGPTKVFVDTEQEARSAIDMYAKGGYEGIKVYSSIKPELVPTIIQLAHAANLRVGGHVPAYMSAEQFVRAGADEIHHVNFLFLNFFFDEVKDTRTPARFTAVAERAGSLDLSSERVRSFVRLLQERDVVVDPTVAIFQAMFIDRPGAVSTSYATVADRVPPQVRRRFLAGGLPVPEGKDAVYRESARALLRMVKILHDAGVRLVPGTDDLAGFTLHRELELYAEAGIPAQEVLQLATIKSARVAGRDAELGSIVPGKFADVILIDGDPARRIGDIRRAALVIKDGNIFEPAALYRSIGVRP